MAKKKIKLDEIIVEQVVVPVQQAIEVVTYSFPSKSRCPRCKRVETRAYCTSGRKQYRKCMHAVCRERYIVVGTKV